MTPTETQDRVLTLAFKSGDREAYARIYELNYERVFNLCRRMLVNRHDAEEATQETFLRVYQGLHRFNGRYLLRAWILRIATNICLDQLRSRGRKPTSVELDECLDLANDIDHGPEESVLRISESAQVRRTLKRLPPMHRAALILRDLEGLSYEEIGVVLALSAAQVKALIHRARMGFKRSWPRHLVEALVPARFLSRLRTDQVPAEAAQVTHLASSAAPYAATCSTFIQQCGQFATERAAAIFTVVAVGASAVGGGAAIANGGVSDPDPMASSSLTDVEMEVAPARIRRKPKDTAGHSSSTQADTPVPAPSPSSDVVPSDPEPAPEPTSEPAQPAGEPSPSPTTSPMSEPSEFTLGFDVPVSPGYECRCLADASETSSTVRITPDGLQRFEQSLEGSASVDGVATYGLSLTHKGDPSSHSATFQLSTKEGAYAYSATGTFESAQRTAWGGFAYSYVGSYSLAGAPTRYESVPKAGSYRATLIFSQASGRIIAANLALVES